MSSQNVFLDQRMKGKESFPYTVPWGSGGTLQKSSQKVGWRASYARWLSAGLLALSFAFWAPVASATDAATCNYWWVFFNTYGPITAPVTATVFAQYYYRYCPPSSLTVYRTGEGTVAGPNIDCGSYCTAQFDKGNYWTTLQATPSTGSLFVGWGGACSGTSTCQVNMGQSQSVTAIFSKPTLKVINTNTIGGTVTDQNNIINCGSQCTAQFNNGTTVTLTAYPSTGYVFGSWTGAPCTGSTCQVPMTQAQPTTVTVTFKPTLTVTKTGSGTVSSNPAGISCGSDCTGYDLNTVVTLTAAPISTDYLFTGWNWSGSGTDAGTCTGTTTPCQVTMTQAKTVTATFKLSTGILSVIPPTSPICAGNPFEVKVQALRGPKDTSPVDGVKVNLKFDPTKLKVNSIASSVLDYVMTKPQYDNTAGTINFYNVVWNNPAPTASFEAFTINFMPLATGNTVLDVQKETISVTSNGTGLTMSDQDGTFSISPCLNYQVTLQRPNNPKPHSSWITPLEVSIGTATNATKQSVTTDDSGRGTLILTKPLAADEYICVKKRSYFGQQEGGVIFWQPC